VPERFALCQAIAHVSHTFPNFFIAVPSFVFDTRKDGMDTSFLSAANRTCLIGASPSPNTVYGPAFAHIFNVQVSDLLMALFDICNRVAVCGGEMADVQIDSEISGHV